MVNLNQDYMTYEMHEIQEENLNEQSVKYPHEKNLKIHLTYEKALSELKALSQMSEYEQYFNSMLGLAPAEACPKVLGVWFDKVEGFMRVALLDEKKPESQLPVGRNNFLSDDISGKVIGLSLKDPSPEWRKIADFSWCSPHLTDSNLYRYPFNFDQDNFYPCLYIFYPNEGSLINPADIVPANAVSSFVIEYRNDHVDGYHIIGKENLDKIYDINRLGDDVEKRENSHRCFFIPYKDVEMAIILIDR